MEPGSGTASFAPKDSIKYSIKGFLGNPLNSMPSYTYYIRLSIVHPTIVHKKKKIQTDEKIVIAETGTTSVFNISDLEIFHAVGYNNETRGAFGIGANITIVETHGSALLDYISRACIDLGIKTPKEATYLLEVMFKNGNAEEIQAGQSEYYFVYPLKFTSMNIQVTEKGGQYRIAATEPGIDALVGPTTKNACTVPAKNLGEFITLFKNFLNKCAQDEVNACHHDVADQYGFIIPKEWESYKFANLEGAEKSNPRTTRYFSDLSKLLIQIPKGSQIPDIITSVFSSIVEFQKIRTADGLGFMKKSPDEPSEKPGEIASYYRLVADMRYGKYDNARKRYTRIYTWWFDTYKEPSVYDTNYMKSFNDSKVMRKRITNLVNEGILTKRYDYNYTGLNTEIIRFDMSFNLSYFRMLPIRAGEQGKSNHLQHAKTRNPHYHETETRTDTKEGKHKTEKKTFVADPVILKVTDLKEAQAALAAETQTNIRKGSKYYLESYGLPDSSDESFFHQVSADTVDAPTDTQGTVTPDASAGMIQFGSHYMELAGGDELAQIDIEIKGDPYWLGNSNLAKEEEGSQTGIADFARYEQGANMFWLNVKSPSEPDEKTGKMKFTDNTTISGIFKVKKVISRFIAGSFVQSLEANRDLATNYDKSRPTLIRFTDEQEVEEAKIQTAMVGEFEGATRTDPNTTYAGEYT